MSDRVARHGGAPTVQALASTRIDTASLYALFDNGLDEAAICELFPELDARDVAAGVAYEQGRRDALHDFGALGPRGGEARRLKPTSRRARRATGSGAEVLPPAKAPPPVAPTTPSELPRRS